MKRVYEQPLTRQMAIDPAGARERLNVLLQDPELDSVLRNRYNVLLNQLGGHDALGSSDNNKRILELQEALKCLPMHPNNMRKRNEIMAELTALGGRFVAELPKAEAEPKPEPPVIPELAAPPQAEEKVDNGRGSKAKNPRKPRATSGRTSKRASSDVSRSRQPRVVSDASGTTVSRNRKREESNE